MTTAIVYDLYCIIMTMHKIQFSGSTQLVVRMGMGLGGRIGHRVPHYTHVPHVMEKLKAAKLVQANERGWEWGEGGGGCSRIW